MGSDGCWRRAAQAQGGEDVGKRSGGMQTRPAGASPAPEPARAEAEGGAVAEEERGGAGPAVGSFSRVALPDAIRVVDEERREIEVCATSEAVDSYGTIFDYAASKTAFERWIGNVREMHERKAVGSKVAVRYDDEARRVYTRVRISRGAEDTWQKILDGTLRGASIGAANVVWHDAVRSPAEGAPAVPVPVATSYELVELSLVDNPSNPDALMLSVFCDGVPDPDGSLDALEEGGAVAAAAAAGGSAGGAGVIDERDGQLSVLDVAAEIARAAQARGQAEIAAAAAGGAATPAADGSAPSRLDRKLSGVGASPLGTGAFLALENGAIVRGVKDEAGH